MSEPAPISVADAGSPFAAAPSVWKDRLDRWSDAASDWFNPILVKESRQALQSRQFAITFTLLLIAGWGWSWLGTSMIPGLPYAPAGQTMLLGYVWILAFPLIVIIPFTAHRSLASEQEDGTYDLLSITTLLPRQIIGGKLGSAILQIAVYMSALSPCVAFTYLLKGVDILLIVHILGYQFLISALLSTVGLLLATFSKSRALQSLLSVFLILALTALYLICSTWLTVILTEGIGIPFAEPEFWIANGFVLSIMAAVFALTFLAASANITFPSENRSTTLRYATWLVGCLIIAWGTRYWLRIEEDDVLFMTICIFVGYWYLMGAMMTGERDQLSERARRKLPRTILGRIWLSWFNPGPVAGYLFAVGNLLTLLIIVVQIHLAYRGAFGRFFTADVLPFTLLLICYAVAYLGFARILLSLISRTSNVNALVALLVHFVLLAIGGLAPFAIQGLMRTWGYTYLQASNFLWTLVVCLDDGFYAVLLAPGPGSFKTPLPVVPVFVIGSALAMIAYHIVLAGRVIVAQRTEAPQRVQDEERQLHPQAEVVQRSSPWDEATE